jgi:hypothetical protein
MAETKQGGPKGPSRPIESIRAELMANPDSKWMADKFGISLEDYVAKVLEYVKDPNKQPMLYIADEAQLKAAGEDIPTTEDIKKWMEGIASGQIDVGPMKFKDGFEAGTPAQKPAASGEAPAGGALREQLQKQMKKPKS